MKQFSFLFLSVLLFLAVACLDDGTALSNDPAAPKVSYDSETLTRVSMTVTGSFPDEARTMEYGIELAENSFSGGPDQVFSLPSCTVDIRPGAVYVVRSYYSNGHYRKSSPVLTITAPLTSAATLNEVTSENNRLIASIRDDGGRTIREAGFCWAEVPDTKAIRKHRIPAEVGSDGSFSLDFSAFESGKTYYILAYAENATASSEVFGYSRTPLEIKISDEIPVSIEDPAFYRYLVGHFDSNRDGFLSTKEIPAITAIDVNTDDIYSLQGIEMMPNLEWLACRGTSAGSGKLTALDVSHNPKITTLYCDNNRLGNLDVSPLPGLTRLSCPGNGLTDLDVSGLFRLVYLDCRNNQLTALDVSQNPYLATLLCDENRLTALDVSQNQDLTVLHCPSNQLGSLQLWNGKLDTLWCFNNQLTSLDISHSQHIREVRCDNVKIPDATFKKRLCERYDTGGDGEISLVEASTIDRVDVDAYGISSLSGIESFPNMWFLVCQGSANSPGGLTSLDLSHNPKLTYVNCSFNRLTSLNLENLASLSELSCSYNQLTELNLDGKPALSMLDCSDNRLTQLDLRPCPELESLMCRGNQLTSLDVSGMLKLHQLHCTNNRMTWLDVTRNPRLTDLECDAVPVADAVFLAYLVQHFDQNGDQAISIAEVVTITEIEVITRYIQSLSGIEYFLNLTRLVCDGYGNPDYPEDGLYGTTWDQSMEFPGQGQDLSGLTALDVSHNTKLITLIITDSLLTTLDVSNNLSLQYLDCASNPYLESLWLKVGQTIDQLYYDDGTSLYYK